MRHPAKRRKKQPAAEIQEIALSRERDPGMIARLKSAEFHRAFLKTTVQPICGGFPKNYPNRPCCFPILALPASRVHPLTNGRG